MEWFPKLWDVLDSLLYESRTRFAGHLGDTIRFFVALGALIACSALSPVFRNLLIGSVSALTLAQMLRAAAPARRTMR